MQKGHAHSAGSVPLQRLLDEVEALGIEAPVHEQEALLADAEGEGPAVPPEAALPADDARGAAHAPRQRGAPRMPAPVRAAGAAEQIFDLPVDGPIRGQLRFNERGFMRAHCAIHGPTCRRQRQTTAGRLGAGRPLGALLAWLGEASDHRTQIEHVCAATHSKRVRVDARRWFGTLPGSQHWLTLERQREPDSGEPEEPDNIP